MNPPLQQGFDSNSQARLPVGVDHLSALFALEQGIVGCVSVPNSTAVGTPFGCVPAINFDQANVSVEASGCEDLNELCEGDAHHSLVELAAYWLEPCELFDGDVSIEPLGDTDYFLNDLGKVGLDVVGFFVANPVLDSLVGHLSLAFHELPAPNVNVLPEIGLVENLPVGCKDSDCKVLGVDIDSENWFCSFCEDVVWLTEVGDDSIPVQSVSLADPAVSQEGLEALVVPVLNDWESETLTWVKGELDEVKELGFERLGVSLANVELDCDARQFVAGRFLPRDMAHDIQDNAVLERGGLLAG